MIAERVLHRLAEQDRVQAEAVAVAPVKVQVAGRAVLLIPHRGDDPYETQLWALGCTVRQGRPVLVGPRPALPLSARASASSSTRSSGPYASATIRGSGTCSSNWRRWPTPMLSCTFVSSCTRRICVLLTPDVILSPPASALGYLRGRSDQPPWHGKSLRVTVTGMSANRRSAG
ncbi:hypothetical protein [Streptomyces sp. NPDC058701]|uniref:hypothetical protein n=1 Tax=Streptomyces sp. NPDC058701 TaxID=3346608 RepID=UPI0036511837